MKLQFIQTSYTSDYYSILIHKTNQILPNQLSLDFTKQPEKLGI